MLKKKILYNVGIYFIIFLIIGLFVRDTSSHLNIFSTISNLMNQATMSDSRSFAQAANDIYLNGWITQNYVWIIHLWPPGFILLQVAILKLFGGSSAYILLILIILNAFLFAISLALLNDYLIPLIGKISAFILPLAILLFPIVRIFMFEPNGILLGESFSISFFLLTIILILRGIKNKSLSNAIYAGFFLGLSCYFRSQFELLVLSLTFFALLIIAWQIISYSKSKDKNRDINKIWIIKTITITMIVTHLLMLPWRIHNFIDYKGISWVQTNYYVALQSLSTTEYLNKHSAHFVAAGAGNIPCILVPKYCGKTDTSLLYKAFVHNIWQWYKIKIPIIARYWFSLKSNFTYIDLFVFSSDLIFNLIFLLLTLSIFPLLFVVRKFSNWPILLWINISFYSAFFVIFTFVHLEARYLYFPKIYGFFMFIILLSHYINEKKRHVKVDIGDK